MQHDTPLHAAASQGQEEAVRILWEKGALMNARNIFHLTPAQLAEQRGHSGLATRLKQLAKTAPPVPAEPTLEP
jgi:ankyrin repeat protein